MLEYLMENFSPWKGPALEHFGKDYCGKDPILEQGRSVMSPSTEEIGASETTYDEMTTDPCPCHPVLLLGNM